MIEAVTVSLGVQEGVMENVWVGVGEQRNLMAVSRTPR